MVIECKNLTVSYGSNTIIDDISFTINKGDYVAILGENGAGKSSLVKCLCSINNNFKGSILVNDDIKNNGINYLSQSTNIQKDFPASVFEIVASGVIKKGTFVFSTKKHKSKVNKYLNLLNISHLKHISFKSLSGGQQQRVLLARALIGESNVLVLDEPFNSLDPIVSNELYKILKTLNEKESLTIIIVSHHIENILKYANRVLHIDKNECVFCSNGEYVKNNSYKNLVNGEKN